MRMIPSRPYDTGSPAEKRIFERLRAAFDDRYAAFHSLKPIRHPRKRFPEIDFVVCGPEGLYAIEVKGGRVACRDGVWCYRDRNGGVARSQESPFRQAETALLGLLEDLRAHLPEDVLDRFTTGYGVVFPDCEWRAAGAEWDLAMLADVRRSRDLEGWLRGLSGYWRARGRGRKGRPDDSALSRLQGYLRPEADGAEREEASRLVRSEMDDHERRLPGPCAEGRVRSLRPEPGALVREEAPRLLHQVEDARRRVARFTDDQMRMADMAEANPRVLCAGGAGTGKTFLAERLARRWAAAGAEVAVVCRSPWLRHFLASRLSAPGVTVSLIDGVRLDCRRSGLARFDALLVDEGQDLFEMRCLDTLDSVLAGGLETGRWCWFHDLNNQSLTHRFEPGAKERLESHDPVRMPLRVNCRNTRVILEWIQEAIDADLGVRGAGAGPAVRCQRAANRRDAAERAAREIVELVDVGGLAPGSVTILSPLGLADSSVAGMPGEAASRVRRLDEYSMRRLPGGKVGFARIDEFKGLENEAVVVVDLPPPERGDGNEPAHYVAMSRARSVLSLIYRDAPPAHSSRGPATEGAPP